MTNNIVNSTLLILFSLFVVILESKVLKLNEIGHGGENFFTAAVYEHKPILALPICYEMSKLV